MFISVGVISEFFQRSAEKYLRSQTNRGQNIV